MRSTRYRFHTVHDLDSFVLDVARFVVNTDSPFYFEVIVAQYPKQRMYVTLGDKAPEGAFRILDHLYLSHVGHKLGSDTACPRKKPLSVTYYKVGKIYYKAFPPL
jgi:hypothetical protein